MKLVKRSRCRNTDSFNYTCVVPKERRVKLSQFDHIYIDIVEVILMEENVIFNVSD